MRARRRWAGLLAGLALALSARPGAADPKACVAANARGNALRSEGKLVEAKAEFLACAADTCPKVIADECRDLVRKVDAGTPTLVFAAVDAKGEDTAAVRVFVNGNKLADRLDTRALPFNPGEYRFRFEAPGGSVRELSVIAREGEKNRVIRVVFDASLAPSAQPAAPAPPSPDRPIPLAAYVVGGLGVAALGSFGYFAITGKIEQTDLESRCAPRCQKDEVGSMRTRYLAADISLGAAVLSLGVATALVLTRPKATAAPAPVVLAGPQGAGIAVVGTF
jgi:hypothetical protein